MSLTLLRASFVHRKNRNPTIDCKRAITACPYVKRWIKNQSIAYSYLKEEEHCDHHQCYQMFLNELQFTHYNAIDFNDDFMHIITFHPHRKQLKKSKNCALLSCRSIKMNYSPNTFINDGIQRNEDVIRQQLFIENRYLQHEQIYHNNKSLREIKSIIKQYPNYHKLMHRYVHNGCNKSSDKLPVYKTGDLFDYCNKESLSYIWCKFPNLKCEWIGFVEVSDWTKNVLRAQNIAQRKDIKKNFVSKNGDDISVVRILVIYEYTANEKLQRQLCHQSRKTRKECNGSYRELKRQNGQFGHTFKLLAETIELFGRNMKNNREYLVLYRGITEMFLFNSATLDCYTPTSTSTSREQATNFAELSGCILELHEHYYLNAYYLSLKPFSKFPSEQELLFYGKDCHLFIKYIQHHISMQNLCSFSEIALIEECISSRKRKRKSNEIFSDENILRLIKLLFEYLDYLSHKNRSIMQMIQLQHIICSKKIIYLRNDVIIKCMNKAFGFDDDTLRISNIIKIFENVEQIIFDYDVEQMSIIHYCLDSNHSCKLWKIIVKRKLKSECSILKDNLKSDWLMFSNSKKKQIVWKKSIDAND